MIPGMSLGEGSSPSQGHEMKEIVECSGRWSNRGGDVIDLEMVGAEVARTLEALIGLGKV